MYDRASQGNLLWILTRIGFNFEKDGHGKYDMMGMAAMTLKLVLVNVMVMVMSLTIFLAGRVYSCSCGSSTLFCLA